MAKILHIITRMDMGGSAQNTLATCIGTADAYEVVLVCGVSEESGMTQAERRAVSEGLTRARVVGVRVVEVSSLVRRIDPIQDAKALLALVRILKAERPEIVHTHTSKAGLLGRIAAILAATPHIVHTMHGHVFYGHFSPPASKFFLWIERLFALWTRRMVALTKGEKDDYLRFKVCPEDKIALIHSGVAINHFLEAEVDAQRMRRELGMPPEGPLVGTVGWLLPIKGPMVLLNAMAKVWERRPDVLLAYVGKGGQEGELSARVMELHAEDRVFFLGWREDVERVLPLFDLFVLPSMNEGMGRVLVEAMAAGRPIVATRTGGIPDLVEEGKNGLLVPPGDAEALALAIANMLDHPEDAARMAEAGRTMCQRWSREAMIEKLLALYREVLVPAAPNV